MRENNRNISKGQRGSPLLRVWNKTAETAEDSMLLTAQGGRVGEAKREAEPKTGANSKCGPFHCFGDGELLPGCIDHGRIEWGYHPGQHGRRGLDSVREFACGCDNTTPEDRGRIAPTGNVSHEPRRAPIFRNARTTSWVSERCVTGFGRAVADLRRRAAARFRRHIPLPPFPNVASRLTLVQPEVRPLT